MAVITTWARNSVLAVTQTRCVLCLLFLSLHQLISWSCLLA